MRVHEECFLPPFCLLLTVLQCVFLVLEASDEFLHPCGWHSTLVYRMAASRCMIKRLVRRISEDMAFPSSITNFLSTDEDFLEHKVQQILEDYVDKEHKIEPQREQEESEKLMETTNPTLRRSVNQTRACGPASMISFPSPRLSTIEINTAMSPITTTMSPAQVQIGALKMFVASLTTPFESISKSVNAAICESEVLQKDTVQGLSFYSGSETTSTNEQLPNVPSCDLGVVTHGCSPSSTLSPTTLLLSSKTGRTVGERIKSTITSRQTPTRLLHRRSSSPPILMGGNDDSVRSTVDSTNGSIERDHDEENDAKMHRQTIQQKCSLSEDVISFLKRTDETIKCIRQRGLALNEEVLPVVKQCNVLTLPSKHRRSFGVPTAEEASQEQGEAPLKISVNFQQVITTKMQQTPPPELLSQASRNSRQDEQRSSNVPSDTRKSYSGHEFGPYGLDLITFGPRSSIASSGWLHTPRQEGPQTPRNEGSHTSRREGSHTPREALTPRPRFRPKNVHSVVSVARPSIAASRRIDAQEICLPPGRPHQTYAYKFPHEFPHTLA
jgi:hypothetical protein